MTSPLSVYDILTPDWLKKTFLMGVTLTDDFGAEYPPEIYIQAIRGAVEILEADLCIKIDPWDIIDEPHDVDIDQPIGYWPISLDHHPIREISAWRVQFGTDTPGEMPLPWINLFNSRFGQVNIVPTVTGNLPGIAWPALGITHASWVPGFFRFDYRAGFDLRAGDVTLPAGASFVDVVLDPPMKDRYTVTLGAGFTASQIQARGFRISATPTLSARSVGWQIDAIPNNIKQAIGQIAAMLPLDIAGDLIAGAGIASSSIGMDGISQSIATTSSATNAGYGSRIIQFRKELEDALPILRGQWRLNGIGAW